jgi:ribonucleoside-triphosphate reductase
MNAKTGDWYITNKQRARSNNSAVLVRGETSFELFNNLLQRTKEFGEPGFMWTSSYEALFNPCAEVGMFGYLIVDRRLYNEYLAETNQDSILGRLNCKPELAGLKSGWQGCNLTTVNCGNIKDEEDFLNRVKAAAIIGTCQAGFTSFDYLGETSENIFKEEALLGVSMTGMMECSEIVLNKHTQKLGAKVAYETNTDIAAKIGIKPAARLTTLKPEGTSSCMLGTCSGIHPHHSKRYLRRLQANINEVPFQFFKNVNLHAVEKSAWDAGNSDYSIIFPIEVPDGAKTKNQLPALDLLQIVKDTQKDWVGSGKVLERCVQPWLSHNVSNTIVVKDDEWEAVGQFIYDNREFFTGISLISDSGDKDYEQAPFCSVYTSREIVKEYGDAALWTSGLIQMALQSFGNLWKACDALTKADFVDKMSVEKTAQGLKEAAAKVDFVNKAKAFAEKYVDNDLKRLTYMMKDVYNWKLYCDLVRNFQHVNWEDLIEEDDFTKAQDEIACAGGACII